MKYLKHFLESKQHAWRGIRYAYAHEPNFRLQLYIAAIVMLSATVLGVTNYELIVLLLLIVSVLTLELFNTAIEALADVVKPRLHEQVRLVKDIAAGMVYLASIASVIIGGMIFYPYFF